VLVDRIIDMSEPRDGSRQGRTITAIKNVTYNEPFFAGHFPHRPVMPGVLIIEAMAQAGALACHRPSDPLMDVAIARMSEVRFRRPVIPGDQLVIRGEVVKDRGDMIVIELKATVEEEPVAEVEILAKVVPKDL